MEGLTLESGREFTPHITLARASRSGPLPAAANRIRLAEVAELFRFEYSLILDRLVLYQSILRPGGAEYKVMKTVGLG